MKNYEQVEVRDNCIDLIRLIAAVCVMFSHSLRWFEVEKPIWSLYFTDGSFGVIAFNVLSGFLIFGSWERCIQSNVNIKEAIRKYIYNRVFRIYPALIASCIFIIAIDIVMKNEVLIINGNTLARILLYCGTAIISDPIKGGYSNGVLWTLFNELLLYLLIPIVYPILSRYNKRQFWVLILSCWLFNWLDSFIVNFQVIKVLVRILGEGGFFPIIMYEYLIGIFVYCFRKDIIPILTNKKYLIPGIIFWSVWYYIYASMDIIPWYGEMHNPTFGILIPWIVIGVAYSFSISLRFDISYGVYLFHMPIVYMMIDLTKGNGLFLPVVWITVIIVAFLICVLIERPFVRVKTKLLYKQ